MRLDLVPHGLLVVLGDDASHRGECGEIHAEVGVWWVDRHSTFRRVRPVDPVELSEEDAGIFGLEDETVYPIRPPPPSTPPSEVRHYDFLCYGWCRDVYLPRSTVHTFTLSEHGGSNGSHWSLAFDGFSWVMDGFDPSIDPIAVLSVHRVMGS